ncbi:hypothetical protein PENTCL1PPCAC_18183 [Pristionchus entomophagus]|uniref:Uncharacterized protein n=1 Tax=Pristionchus entomophagus TaxID=358040 RepID=A0AAV5TP43_9BILA|nr:hypothetical protein PENTCL1PPCAC_18183 [Pristionchus entomophagus]
MEKEKDERAAIRITSWICDRLAIRAAKKELEERRMKREEEEKEMERMRVEEESRRKKEKKAVERIEMWYSSILSIRTARSLLQLMREERWKSEQEERLERERLAKEEEERLKREEEERMERERVETEELEREEVRRLFVLKETAACKIQTHYRGWRMVVEAKEELERRREEKREEQRRLREEEERLERERLAREEEERVKREEEERLKREEEERLIRKEKERLERERLAREEEERVKKEEEYRLREEEARLEQERQLKEEREKEKERLRREEGVRMEMEVKRKEEERRREDEELKEWAARQKEKEEAIYQEMVAAQERDRRLEEMRKNRAARAIQSWMKLWLQKMKVERRTMQLLESMEGERPREGRNNQRMTIGGVSDDRLLAGVREIKRRQRKLSLTLYRMTSISTVTAATRIQAWWRGIRTRRRERVKIELIGVRMREYNQKANQAMEGDQTERAIPVSKRLERAKNSLENPLRLYDIKVACYTTMSLCRLSSLYCERAIVLDLPALLINMFTIQADRSPAFEEIIEFGVQAIEEMVKCTTARVRSEMVDQGAEVVRLTSHWMLAFLNNRFIPARAMRILRMCKDILPVESHAEIFEKLHTYYLKKVEEKFGKLPSKDDRNKELILLKKAFAK